MSWIPHKYTVIHGQFDCDDDTSGIAGRVYEGILPPDPLTVMKDISQDIKQELSEGQSCDFRIVHVSSYWGAACKNPDQWS